MTPLTSTSSSTNSQSLDVYPSLRTRHTCFFRFDMSCLHFAFSLKVLHDHTNYNAFADVSFLFDSVFAWGSIGHALGYFALVSPVVAGFIFRSLFDAAGLASGFHQNVAAAFDAHRLVRPDGAQARHASHRFCLQF